MSLLKWGTRVLALGVALALSTTPAGATSISFAEVAEDQNVSINAMLDPGVTRLAMDQVTPLTGRVELSFPLPFPLQRLNAWAVLREPSGGVSDYVFLSVTPRPAQGDARVLVGFQSDPFTFREFPAPPARVRAQGLLEDGTVQDVSAAFFRIQNAMAVNVPLTCPTCGMPFLTVSVQSDLEPVPEPTTILLFGTAVAGLGLAARWRRRKLN